MYITGGFPNRVRIGTDDNISFLENNSLKLFLMESGREYWVRQVYEMILMGNIMKLYFTNYYYSQASFLSTFTGHQTLSSIFRPEIKNGL